MLDFRWSQGNPDKFIVRSTASWVVKLRAKKTKLRCDNGAAKRQLAEKTAAFRNPRSTASCTTSERRSLAVDAEARNGFPPQSHKGGTPWDERSSGPSSTTRWLHLANLSWDDSSKVEKRVLWQCLMLSEGRQMRGSARQDPFVGILIVRRTSSRAVSHQFLIE